jgi:hypothetical protein
MKRCYAREIYGGIFDQMRKSAEGVGMKKFIMIVCMGLMIATTGAFAQKGEGLAIGGEAFMNFSGTAALPVGGALVVHLPGVPLMFAIGANSLPALGITADYWLGHGPIAGILDWYIGVGAYLTMYLSPNSVALGARVPFGIQLWPAGQNLEFFLEAAPGLGVNLSPTQFEWHLRVALGLRYWI